MPFTPYHFGAHACASLPFRHQLDVPVFIAANVVIDLEPLLVLGLHLDYPVHGYAHTLLFGGAIGLGFGALAYPFRAQLGAVQVAVCQTGAADTQLAGYADRHRLQTGAAIYILQE